MIRSNVKKGYIHWRVKIFPCDTVLTPKPSINIIVGGPKPLSVRTPQVHTVIKTLPLCCEGKATQCPVLWTQHGADTSHLANSNAAFIRKLRCHWPKGQWQHCVVSNVRVLNGGVGESNPYIWSASVSRKSRGTDWYVEATIFWYIVHALKQDCYFGETFVVGCLESFCTATKISSCDEICVASRIGHCHLCRAEIETLKTESCHSANFVVTGGTGGCRWQHTVPPVTAKLALWQFLVFIECHYDDNSLCSRWRK